MRTTGKQCGLAATGVYQPSLRSPWLAAFEQSDTEIYASHAGLVVAGPIINRHSGLKKRLKSIPLRHGIAHIDLVRTYLGLLCQGKNDFEAVEGIRKDPFFQQALGIGRVPSSARLRQRFDEQAET